MCSTRYLHTGWWELKWFLPPSGHFSAYLLVVLNLVAVLFPDSWSSISWKRIQPETHGAHFPFTLVLHSVKSSNFCLLWVQSLSLSTLLEFSLPESKSRNYLEAESIGRGHLFASFCYRSEFCSACCNFLKWFQYFVYFLHPVVYGEWVHPTPVIFMWA